MRSTEELTAETMAAYTASHGGGAVGTADADMMMAASGTGAAAAASGVSVSASTVEDAAMIP